MTTSEGPAFGCAWEGQSVEELFAATGGLLDGHFILTSGRHAGRYLEKFWVLQYPELAVEIGRRMADALIGVRADPGGRADHRRGAAGPRDGAPARGAAGPHGARHLRRARSRPAVGGCAAAGAWRPTSGWCWSTTS